MQGVVTGFLSIINISQVIYLFNLREYMSVASPCVRKCCLNEDDICLGCYRHLEEIKRWSAATDARKLVFLHNAKSRRAKDKNRYDFTWR